MFHMVFTQLSGRTIGLFSRGRQRGDERRCLRYSCLYDRGSRGHLHRDGILWFAGTDGTGPREFTHLISNHHRVIRILNRQTIFVSVVTIGLLRSPRSEVMVKNNSSLKLFMILNSFFGNSTALLPA